MAEIWPDELDLQVTGIAQGGDGVGRWEGRTVFASGALPGERVRVRLYERQRAFARGTTVAIETAAPERNRLTLPARRPLRSRRLALDRLPGPATIQGDDSTGADAAHRGPRRGGIGGTWDGGAGTCYAAATLCGR